MMILIFVIVGSTVVIASHWLWHLHKLRTHEGCDRKDFVDYYDKLGIASGIAGAVYDELRRLGLLKSFNTSPADTLEGTYKIVDEDIEAVLTEILGRTGCEMPNSRKLAEWQEDLLTVDDVVRWTDWVWKQKSVV